MVGVGVTITVTVVVIVMNSGDAVFTHEGNNNSTFEQHLKHNSSTSYYLRYEGKCSKVVFNWCLCVYVPCEVDDGEGRGEGVISGIPVVSDGGPTVGRILTANYEGNKDALHNVLKLYSQVMSISACQHCMDRKWT